MISNLMWTASKSDMAYKCRNMNGATWQRAAHQTDRRSWIVGVENVMYTVHLM